MPAPVSAAGNGVATPVAPDHAARPSAKPALYSCPGTPISTPASLERHGKLSRSTCKNIQGNILGGFNKDFQTMLFLHFTDPVKGRAWLAHMARNVASSDDVLAFNNLFKLLRARHGREGSGAGNVDQHRLSPTAA